MVFIGMDHGTTGISFCIMSDDGEVVDVFKIGREESKQGKVSAIEELSKRIDLESIDLMAVTYAMGDGINKIQNIAQVKIGEFYLLTGLERSLAEEPLFLVK